MGNNKFHPSMDEKNYTTLPPPTLICEKRKKKILLTECYIFIEPFTFYVKHFSILLTIRKVLNASIYKTYIVKSKYVFSISSTIFKISDANESEKFHNATRRHSNLQIHGYIVEQRGVQTDNNNGRFGFD